MKHIAAALNWKLRYYGEKGIRGKSYRKPASIREEKVMRSLSRRLAAVCLTLVVVSGLLARRTILILCRQTPE